MSDNENVMFVVHVCTYSCCQWLVLTAKNKTDTSSYIYVGSSQLDEFVCYLRACKVNGWARERFGHL